LCPAVLGLTLFHCDYGQWSLGTSWHPLTQTVGLPPAPGWAVTTGQTATCTATPPTPLPPLPPPLTPWMLLTLVPCPASFPSCCTLSPPNLLPTCPPLTPDYRLTPTVYGSLALLVGYPPVLVCLIQPLVPSLLPCLAFKTFLHLPSAAATMPCPLGWLVCMQPCLIFSHTHSPL